MMKPPAGNIGLTIRKWLGRTVAALIAAFLIFSAGYSIWAAHQEFMTVTCVDNLQTARPRVRGLRERLRWPNAAVCASWPDTVSRYIPKDSGPRATSSTARMPLGHHSATP